MLSTPEPVKAINLSPLLERRGGRDIQEKREASFVGADGVVAHETIFGERPPRLREAMEASRNFC